MKFNDSIFGIIAIIFAIVEVSIAYTFPSLHGQRFDSSNFPVLIGFGLFVSGCLLIHKGMKQHLTEESVGAAFVSASDWIGNNASVINFIVVLLSVVFFIIFVDKLGFSTVSFLILTILFLRFGNKLTISLLSAVLITVCIKLVFGGWLLVPLPTSHLGF